MISFAVPLCLSYGCKYASKRITSKPNFFIYFLNPRQPGLFKKDDYVSHLSQTMLSHLFSCNRNVTPSKVTLSHNHFRPVTKLRLAAPSDKLALVSPIAQIIEIVNHASWRDFRDYRRPAFELRATNPFLYIANKGFIHAILNQNFAVVTQRLELVIRGREKERASY